MKHHQHSLTQLDYICTALGSTSTLTYMYTHVHKCAHYIQCIASVCTKCISAKYIVHQFALVHFGIAFFSEWVYTLIMGAKEQSYHVVYSSMLGFPSHVMVRAESLEEGGLCVAARHNSDYSILNQSIIRSLLFQCFIMAVSAVQACLCSCVLHILCIHDGCGSYQVYGLLVSLSHQITVHPLAWCINEVNRLQFVYIYIQQWDSRYIIQRGI